MSAAATREMPASVLGNLGTLLAGKAAGDLFTFLFFLLLSRRFGPEGLGHYSLAMAATGLVLVVGEGGLAQLTIRELALGRSYARVFGDVMLLRLGLALAATAAVVGIVPWLPIEPAARAALLAVGLYHATLPLVDGFAAVFVAREIPRAGALLQMSLRLTIATAGGLVVVAGGGFAAVLAVLPAMTMAHAAAGAALVVRRFGWPDLVPDRERLLARLREARPFALSDVLFHVGSRADVLLLTVLIGAAAAGTYNAAYRIAHLWMFLAHVASLAALPAFARLWNGPRAAWRELQEEALGLAWRIGLPAAAGTWLVAPSVVELLYGEAFAPAVTVLRLLAPLFLLAPMRTALESALVAVGCERDRVRHQVLVAAGAVAALALLVPLCGAAGAAGVAVGAEGALALLHARRLARVAGPLGPPDGVIPTLAATAAFLIPLAGMDPLPLPIALGVAMGIHGSTLLLFARERDRLLRSLPGLRLATARAGRAEP